MRILQLKEGGGGVDDSQQDLFIAAHTHTHIHCAVSNRFFRVCRELLSTESPTHVTDFTLIAGIRVALITDRSKPKFTQCKCRTLLSQIIAVNQVGNPKRKFPTQLFQLETLDRYTDGS